MAKASTAISSSRSCFPRRPILIETKSDLVMDGDDRAEKASRSGVTS
jgi:hypothetical protein